MNRGFRRFIHTRLISYVRNPVSKRGFLTCHINGRVENRNDNLVPYLSFQFNNTGIKCMNKLDIAKIKNSPVRNTVIDPIIHKGEISIPTNAIIRDFELPTFNNRELIDSVENVIEKKAHKMIRIRKRKMKKHKWKKLQKKMKFVFLKIKRKRRQRKEREFQEELKKIVAQGETFNADKVLQEKIEHLTWEKPLVKIRGIYCPKWVVDAHLETERKKKILDERVANCLKKMN